MLREVDLTHSPGPQQADDAESGERRAVRQRHARIVPTSTLNMSESFGFAARPRSPSCVR